MRHETAGQDLAGAACTAAAMAGRSTGETAEKTCVVFETDTEGEGMNIKRQISKSANRQKAKGQWSIWLEGRPVDDLQVGAVFIIAIGAIVYLALKHGSQILRVLGGG